MFLFKKKQLPVPCLLHLFVQLSDDGAGGLQLRWLRQDRVVEAKTKWEKNHGRTVEQEKSETT